MLDTVYHGSREKARGNPHKYANYPRLFWSFFTTTRIIFIYNRIFIGYIQSGYMWNRRRTSSRREGTRRTMTSGMTSATHTVSTTRDQPGVHMPMR